MMGMSLSDDEDSGVTRVGLSVMSLRNLSGILDLDFPSSWTSSICPILRGEMGTGAMEIGNGK